MAKTKSALTRSVGLIPVFDDDDFDVGEWGRGLYRFLAEKEHPPLGGVPTTEHLNLYIRTTAPASTAAGKVNNSWTGKCRSVFVCCALFYALLKR